MSNAKDGARLAAEELKVEFFIGELRNGAFASDDKIAAIIRKHFPVALPVSGEIPTPRSDSAYQDALECEIKDDTVPYAFARQLEREGVTYGELLRVARVTLEIAKEEKDKLKSEIATERAAREKSEKRREDLHFEMSVLGALLGASGITEAQVAVKALQTRAESAEQELQEYVAKTDPLLACVDPTQETPHCGKCMVCLGVRAEAAEANAAKMREALEEVVRTDAEALRELGKIGVEPGPESLRLSNLCRAALASVPAGSVSQDTKRKRNAAHSLAMMALQSERYGNDPDYRDATDNVLAWTMPPAMSANSGERGKE